MTQRDLQDAVDHISYVNDFKLSEFDQYKMGEVNIDSLEYYDDFSSWVELDAGELIGSSEEEIEKALTSYRDASFAKRALGWIKNKKFPPIVLIAFPDEEGPSGFDATIGDGRGRINVATAMGIQKLPLIYLVHKDVPDDLDIAYDEVKQQVQANLKRTLIAALEVVIADLELKLFSWGDKEEPITEEDLEGAFQIKAFQNGKEVGYANVYREGSRWYVFEVEVNEKHRRQGIATKLYDYADEVTGSNVMPQVLDSSIGDPQISDDAFQFWKKRRPDLVEDILEAVTDENREDLLKL